MLFLSLMVGQQGKSTSFDFWLRSSAPLKSLRFCPWFGQLLRQFRRRPQPEAVGKSPGDQSKLHEMPQKNIQHIHTYNKMHNLPENRRSTGILYDICRNSIEKNFLCQHLFMTALSETNLHGLPTLAPSWRLWGRLVFSIKLPPVALTRQT